MPANFYPVWTSGATDAVQPQIYQWAGADRAGQEANIGRRTAYDQQAIANAQNYYQAQRAMEAEDARRQSEADRQTLIAKEAADRTSEYTNNKRYEFGIRQKESEAERKQAYDIAKMKFAGPTAAELDAEAQRLMATDALANKFDFGAAPELHAKAYETTPASVASFIATNKGLFAERARAALQAKADAKIAKNPNADVSGLIAEAPEWLQPDIGFDRAKNRFSIATTPTGQRYQLNPMRGAEPPPGSQAPQGFWPNLIHPTGTPPSAPAPYSFMPAMSGSQSLDAGAPQLGNQGGGYAFGGATDTATAPPPPPAPAPPPQVGFIVMTSPKTGQRVKVQTADVPKARSLGYQ